MEQLAKTSEVEADLETAAELQEQMQAEAVALQMTVEHQAEEISDLYAKVRALGETIEGKEEEIAALEKTVKQKEHSAKMSVLAVTADLDQEKRERAQELANLRITTMRLTERADTAEKALAVTCKERDAALAQLEASKARVLELEAEAAERIATFEKELASVQKRCDAAEASEKELGDEMVKLQEQQKLMTDITMERDALTTERDGLATELEATSLASEKQISELEADREKTQEELQQVTYSLSETREKLNQAESLKALLSKEAAELVEREAELEAQVQEMRDEEARKIADGSAGLEHDLADARGEVERLKQLCDKQRTELEELRASVAQKDKELNDLWMEKQSNAALMMMLKAEKQAAIDELQVWHSDMQSAMESGSQKDVLAALKGAQAKGVQAELAKAEERVAEKQTEVDAVKEEVVELTEKLAKRDRDVEQLQEAAEAADGDEDALWSKLQMMQEEDVEDSRAAMQVGVDGLGKDMSELELRVSGRIADQQMRHYKLMGTIRQLASRVASLREIETKYKRIYEDLQETTDRLQDALRRATAAEAEAAILATGQDQDAAKAVLKEAERKMKEQQDELLKSLGARMRRDVERSDKDAKESKARAVDAENKSMGMKKMLNETVALLLTVQTAALVKTRAERGGTALPWLFEKDRAAVQIQQAVRVGQAAKHLAIQAAAISDVTEQPALDEDTSSAAAPEVGTAADPLAVNVTHPMSEFVKRAELAEQAASTWQSKAKLAEERAAGSAASCAVSEDALKKEERKVTKLQERLLKALTEASAVNDSPVLKALVKEETAAAEGAAEAEVAAAEVEELKASIATSTVVTIEAFSQPKLDAQPEPDPAASAAAAAAAAAAAEAEAAAEAKAAEDTAAAEGEAKRLEHEAAMASADDAQKAELQAAEAVRLAAEVARLVEEQERREARAEEKSAEVAAAVAVQVAALEDENQRLESEMELRELKVDMETKAEVDRQVAQAAAGLKGEVERMQAALATAEASADARAQALEVADAHAAATAKVAEAVATARAAEDAAAAAAELKRLEYEAAMASADEAHKAELQEAEAVRLVEEQQKKERLAEESRKVYAAAAVSVTPTAPAPAPAPAPGQVAVASPVVAAAAPTAADPKPPAFHSTAVLHIENNALRANISSLETQLANAAEATVKAAEAAAAAREAENAAAAAAEAKRLEHDAAMASANAAQKAQLQELEAARLAEEQERKERLAEESRKAYEQACEQAAAVASGAAEAASEAVIEHQAVAATSALAEVEKWKEAEQAAAAEAEIGRLREAEAVALTQAEEAELQIAQLEQQLKDQSRQMEAQSPKPEVPSPPQQPSASPSKPQNVAEGFKKGSKTPPVERQKSIDAWGGPDGNAFNDTSGIESVVQFSDEPPPPAEAADAWSALSEEAPAGVKVETKPAEFLAAKEVTHAPMQTELTSEMIDEALASHGASQKPPCVTQSATTTVSGSSRPMTPEIPVAAVLTQQAVEALTDLQQLVDQGSADGHEVVEALQQATSRIARSRESVSVQPEHWDTIYGGVMRLGDAFDELTGVMETTAEATAQEQAAVAGEIRNLHGQFRQLVTERDAYRVALDQAKAAIVGGAALVENPLKTGGEERLAMWLGDEAAADAVREALPPPIPSGAGPEMAAKLSSSYGDYGARPTKEAPAPAQGRDGPARSSFRGGAGGTNTPPDALPTSAPLEPPSPLDQWESAQGSPMAMPGGGGQSTAEAAATADRLVAEVSAAKAASGFSGRRVESSAPAGILNPAPVPLVDASPGEGGGLLMTGGQPNAKQTTPMQVQVPEGYSAGSQLTVQAPNGQQISVTVPPGLAPGASFIVQAPTSQNNPRRVQFEPGPEEGDHLEEFRGIGGGYSGNQKTTAQERIHFDPDYRKGWQEPTPPAKPLSPRTRERPRGSQKPGVERQAVGTHKPSFNPSQWDTGATDAHWPPDKSHQPQPASGRSDSGANGGGGSARHDAPQPQPPPRNTIAGAQPMGLKYVRSKRDGKLHQKMVPIEPAPAPMKQGTGQQGEQGGAVQVPDYVKERQKQKTPKRRVV